MAARALIIAIESYNPHVVGLAKSLPGTLQAGLDFRDWLTRKWQVEGLAAKDTQILFCSEPLQPSGRGATRADIVACLQQLKTDGSGQTDELFVFFSGHGFAFVDGEDRADIIIASDFVDAASSGHACLNLDWIVDWLRYALGKGRHYYFVDACRNAMNGNTVAVSNQLLPRTPGGSSNVSTYVLQSTLPGSFAPVGKKFPSALIDGLHGKGKAKVWESGLRDGMRVKYDSLRRFVTDRLEASQPITSSVKGPEGESDAVLATIRPVPTVNLKIKIDGARSIPGHVLISRGRAPAGEPLAFDRWPQTLPLEPDTYTVEVHLTQSKLSGTNPLTLDLYDDYEHSLSRIDPFEGFGPPPPPSSESEWTNVIADTDVLSVISEVDVDVVVPPRSSIKLRNIDTGHIEMVSATQRIRLPQGRYSSSLRTSNRALVRRRDLDLTAGGKLIFDPSIWRESLPMASIARHFPKQDDWPDFSESLGGPVVDPDLDVWLALIGGGSILNGIEGEDFHKIDALPLRDFRHQKAGSSPIYVLAGMEDAQRRLDIRVERDRPRWRRVTRTKLPGVSEFYQAVSPGPQLVSFRLDGSTTYTVASAAMANRATLLTLTLDADHSWRVAQYLLPLGKLTDQLPPEVLAGLSHGSALEKLRFLAQAQRAFHRRQDLAKEFDTEDLQYLQYASWVDPIGSALGSYELIRRGQSDLLPAVVSKMQEYFSDLPDTGALARLCGLALTAPNGTPLFQDGLSALFEDSDFLPLPSSHLDFNSTWTAWRVAVK